MHVSVLNHQKDFSICSWSVKRVVVSVCEFLDIITDFVDVRFVTKEKMMADHQKIFNDPSPTDVISLPIDSPGSEVFPSMLGEIIVCPDFAFSYIQKKNREEYNPFLFYQEVTLYIVHGLLHLIGYDDICLSDRKKMQQCQRKVMLHLKQKMIFVTKSNKRKPQASTKKSV